MSKIKSPENRLDKIKRQVDTDVIATLIDELESGYRMNTMRKEIVTEKIHLIPLELDSLENVESQMRDEIDRNPGSFVEYQKMSMERYSALVGCHSDAFNGLNGEEFFPASHVELATSTGEQVRKKYDYNWTNLCPYALTSFLPSNHCQFSRISQMKKILNNLMNLTFR